LCQMKWRSERVTALRIERLQSVERGENGLLIRSFCWSKIRGNKSRPQEAIIRRGLSKSLSVYSGPSQKYREISPHTDDLPMLY